MAQLQSTSITGSLIVTGGITGSFSGSIASPGSNTQVLYNNSGVISANSGFVYNSGNVGINTTSPTSKLTVNGNTHIIGSGTPGSGAGMELQYSSNTSYIGSYDRDSSVYRNLFFYSADTIFENGGTERMRITSAGNVGIGTSGPSARLFISAPALGTSAGDYSLNSIHYNINSNAEELEIKSVREASGNDWTYGGKRIQLRIDSTYMGYMQFNGYGNNYGISFGTGGTTSAPGNVTERMRITNGGNVGIGTTSPQGKLSVDGGDFRFNYGNASANYYFYLNKNSSNDGGILLTRDNSTFDWQIVNLDGSGNLAFYSYGASTQAVTFQRSSGNVGIGTTSPAQKLHVIGNTAVTGFTSTGGRKLSLGILDLNDGGTPTQIRINTTIPLNSPSADFTVNIKGFRYGAPQMVSLSIGWHYYLGSFYNETVISNGAWKPTVTLAQDANGYVVIHLSSPGYWPKLYVESLYSSAYGDTYSSGWTFTDANLSDCTNVEVVPYQPLATDISGNAGSTSAVSGTTNYVSKFASSTTIGNSQIFDDGTNVGIGTASPSAKLTVSNGVAYFTQTASNGSAFRWGLLGTAVSPDTMLCMNQLWNGSGWTILDSGVGTSYINLGSQVSSPNIEFGTGPTNTAATTKMIITNGGNVGIGTTSPDVLLHIYGPGSTITRYTNTSNSGHYVDVGANNAGESFVYGYGAYPLLFGTNGSERIRILSGGNVGIGTSSPNTTLEINKNVSFSSVDTYAQLVVKTTSGANGKLLNIGVDESAGLSFIQSLNRGTDSMPLILQRYSGNVGIGTTSPSVKLDVNGTGKFGAYAYIGTSIDQGYYQDIDNGAYRAFSGATNPGYYFQKYNGSATTMYIGLDGTYAGRVGIGTTTPAYNLHIAKASSEAGILTSYGASDIYLTHGGWSMGAGKFGIGDGSSPTITIDAPNDRLGIGTTSPIYLVDAYSTSATTNRISIGGTTNYSLIQAFNDSGTLYLGIDNSSGTGFGTGNYTRVLYSGDNYPLAISTNGTERMRIDSSGNVMIGTTTPLLTTSGRGTLTLNGSSTSILTLSNGGTWASYLYAESTGVYLAANGSSRVLSFEVNNAERLRISTAGAIRFLNYGSGTNTGTVAYNLAVDSSGNVIETAGGVVDGSGTANYIPKWSDSNTIGNSVIYESSSNIGIGTTSPGAKLEVNGSFRATTKSFIIDHPTKENKKLQYGVLEGPEHSIYVRGKLTNTNVIQLPDYWHALVHEDSITVNLTAIGKKQDLWVEEITDTHITIASETGDINCFYAVFAERKDVEKLVTEFDKE
jgi:hypothetical protein